MRCATARELIQLRMDGALDDARLPPVERHLQACAACRAEARGLERASRLLAALPAAPTRDIWPGVVDRLSVEGDCLRVADALPALAEGGIPGAAGRVALAHVERCGRCGEEYRALQAALERLETLEQAPPPELWLRVRAAVEAEEPRRPVRWAPRGWVLSNPGMAVASVALVLAIGIRLLYSPALDAEPLLPAPTLVTSPPPEAVVRPTSPEPPGEMLAVAPAGGGQRYSAAEAESAPAAPVRIHSADDAPAIPRPSPEPTLGTAREPSLAAQLHVSFPGPAEGAVVRPADVRPLVLIAQADGGVPGPESAAGQADASGGDEPDMERQVMDEVVAAVRLLAGIEEISVRPFSEAPLVP